MKAQRNEVLLVPLQAFCFQNYFFFRIPLIFFLTFLSSFSAHTNSLARITSPRGITTQAGPGVKTRQHPKINTLKPAMPTRIFFTLKQNYNLIFCAYCPIMGTSFISPEREYIIPTIQRNTITAYAK